MTKFIDVFNVIGGGIFILMAVSVLILQGTPFLFALFLALGTFWYMYPGTFQIAKNRKDEEEVQ